MHRGKQKLVKCVWPDASWLFHFISSYSLSSPTRPPFPRLSVTSSQGWSDSTANIRSIYTPLLLPDTDRALRRFVSEWRSDSWRRCWKNWKRAEKGIFGDLVYRRTTSEGKGGKTNSKLDLWHYLKKTLLEYCCVIDKRFWVVVNVFIFHPFLFAKVFCILFLCDLLVPR